MRDLIRRDQERAARIAAIQAMIIEGLASGEAKPFDVSKFLARKRKEHGCKAR